MNIVQCLCQELRLEVTGGTTQSIFPIAEAWLLDCGDHQMALQYVAHKKKMDRYCSMMDFLFCELFIRYRNECFRFYEGGGKPLKELISEAQRQDFQRTLIAALLHAYRVWRKRRKLDWVKFRWEIQQKIMNLSID
jgi:hypothetical protein